ncbi:MAG: hypothetical protein Aurels2KO_04280 [Aureliella sp.]
MENEKNKKKYAAICVRLRGVDVGELRGEQKRGSENQQCKRKTRAFTE